MFDEVVAERVKNTRAEYDKSVSTDMASLQNIKKILDDARVTTKSKRDRFFQACEELLEARMEKNRSDKPVKSKAQTKVKKAEKVSLENAYRDAYVNSTETVQGQLFVHKQHI